MHLKQSPRSFPWLLLGVLCFCLSSQAGRGPNYKYGESWWREYVADPGTDLLLHFGKPQVSARQQLTAQIEKKKESEIDLDDLTVETEAAPGLDELKLQRTDPQAPPVIDDSNVPATEVQDYVQPRRRLPLPKGMKKGPGGRYGDGLHCSGEGKLTAFVAAPRSIECWFKIKAYPQTESCILSVERDEARLLLLPDGRLEFRLKKPHGNPGVNPNLDGPMSEEQKALILAKPAEMVSPAPVPLNEWTHVCIWQKPHPTPGGGEPWDAQLKINGEDVAFYLSERYNDYHFFGRRQTELVIGNNANGAQGFQGMIDEVRTLTENRTFYQRPPMPWRDPQAERKLQFDRPWFRNDSTAFRASLDADRSMALDKVGAGPVALDLLAGALDGVFVPGVRGRGWVADPKIGFPRVPLKGISATSGALEFWFRPVNWDDCTGYWHHSPPKGKSLSILRFYGRDKTDGKVKQFASINLDRAYNIERGRMPLDPGRWYHLVAVWSGQSKWGGVYLNTGSGRPKKMGFRRNLEVLKAIEPLYAEFGIPNQVKPKWGAHPLLEIDEVVGYTQPLADDEVAQAYQRWQGKLKPIPLYNAKHDFKWSLQRLTFHFKPMLPAGQVAARVAVALHDLDQDGKCVRGPVSTELGDKGGTVLLNDGQTLPYANYQFRFTAVNADGKELLTGASDWEYREDPWRHNTAGILKEAPPPWTPIKADKNRVETRMTRYVLGPGGLPTEIHADGENILGGPIQILEAGQPMKPVAYTMGPSKNVEVEWGSRFIGETCDIEMACHAEYDGMIKYSLQIKPKKKLAPISFVMPVADRFAKRFLYYPMGARGVSTGVVSNQDKLILESRVAAGGNAWRKYKQAQRKNQKLKWAEFYEQYRQELAAYGFFGHVDIHDMNRGLWWFCDNAAGWRQSKTVSAIEIRRKHDDVALILNLIAEPVEYQADQPIVFGILPHPARPLPGAYRRYNRVEAKVDRRNCNIYDAFRPWPMDPKAGAMKMFPAADPKNPEAGSSWEYAESCIPNMKATMPAGLRTMYLSKAWFSCRAGAYDGWEWRSGGGAVSLTPWFVNYLCWEMNEWIGRGIWDAIYLDECYEHPAKNLLAGFSVKLPDGSEQPGVTNFQFRELMKRWRNIFHQHGKKPMLIAHHTYSWQYHGLVFCDSCLDGENAPIVSLTSRDWIDSTSKHRYETLQNSRLWGISSFYMPFISEGGFHNKGLDRYKRWQWRMARQAQSQFAHYEVATVYEGQGSQVYKQFWNDVFRFGAMDPDDAGFHPYWDNESEISVEGQGDDALVSFYKRPGKILLIASNRRPQDHEIKIKLNRAALGLKGALTLQHWDSSYPPAPGADQVSKKELAAMKEKASSALERNMQTGGDLDGKTEDALDEIDEFFEDEKKEKQKAASQPRVEGDTVILPCRPKDFRMVVIESK